jgi:hypothetical protein
MQDNTLKTILILTICFIAAGTALFHWISHMPKSVPKTPEQTKTQLYYECAAYQIRNNRTVDVCNNIK